MGCIISSAFKDQLTDTMIDDLQKGLKQFEGHREFSLDYSHRKWRAEDVFGSEYSRNQAFRALKNEFDKALTAGFKLAKYKMMNANGYMEDFISSNVANHIIKCLLTPGIWKGEVVEVKYDEVVRDRLGLSLELPKYDVAKIQAFKDVWLAVAKQKSPGVTTLETTDEAERMLLSSIVSAMIINGIVSKINLPQIIADAIKIQVQKDTAAALHLQGVFAQVPQLLASRQEYSEDQRKDDFAKSLLSQ